MNEILELPSAAQASIGHGQRSNSQHEASAFATTILRLFLSLIAMASITGLTLVHAGLPGGREIRTTLPVRNDETRSTTGTDDPTSRTFDGRSAMPIQSSVASHASTHARRAQVVVKRLARSVLLTLASPLVTLKPSDEGTLVIRATTDPLSARSGFSGVVTLRLCLSLRHGTVVGPRCTDSTVDPSEATKIRARFHYRATTEGALLADVTTVVAAGARPEVKVTRPERTIRAGEVTPGTWGGAEAHWKRFEAFATPLVALIATVVGIYAKLRRRRRQPTAAPPTSA